jgi:hypothetical protein
MVLTDSLSRNQFKRAVFAICGTDEPTRSQLRDVGRQAALWAARSIPWGGDHIYALLHPDKWPKYGIHPNLLDQVMKRAQLYPLNGTQKVCVFARRVRAGAVVLGRSRRCAGGRCGIHFIGRTPNQRYCSDACERRVAAYRRKERRRMRREKVRRRR